eukprot:SAG11_NODE_692_length_7698_cov_4.143308_3_plen_80_part_00
MFSDDLFSNSTDVSTIRTVIYPCFVQKTNNIRVGTSVIVTKVKKLRVNFGHLVSQSPYVGKPLRVSANKQTILDITRSY